MNNIDRIAITLISLIVALPILVVALHILVAFTQIRPLQEARARASRRARAAHLEQILDCAPLINSWHTTTDGDGGNTRLHVVFRGSSHLVAKGNEIPHAVQRLVDARKAVERFKELTSRKSA